MPVDEVFCADGCGWRDESADSFDEYDACPDCGGTVSYADV
jgi:hypothetical protein